MTLHRQLVIFISFVWVALMAGVSCSIGFLVRSTAGTVAIVVALLLVIPNIVGLFPHSISRALERFLPDGLLGQMLATAPKASNFSPGVATAILVGYTVVLAVVAGWVLVHRDA